MGVPQFVTRAGALGLFALSSIVVGCAADAPPGTGSDEAGPPADLTIEEAEAMGFSYGKGDHSWDLCEWFGIYGNGSCEWYADRCPHPDSDCLEGEACVSNDECGQGGMCWCNECVVGDYHIMSEGDVSAMIACPEPAPGFCNTLDQVDCYRRPDCNWNETTGDDSLDPTFGTIGMCESRGCPATGIVCTPDCPASGTIGGAPCQQGEYNETTCTCDPVGEECNGTICGPGEYCTWCWVGEACIPIGAVC